MSEDSTRPLDNVIRIDDERIQDHLGKIVRGSVEGEEERGANGAA